MYIIALPDSDNKKFPFNSLSIPFQFPFQFPLLSPSFPFTLRATFYFQLLRPEGTERSPKRMSRHTSCQTLTRLTSLISPSSNSLALSHSASPFFPVFFFHNPRSLSRSVNDQWAQSLVQYGTVCEFGIWVPARLCGASECEAYRASCLEHVSNYSHKASPRQLANYRTRAPVPFRIVQPETGMVWRRGNSHGKKKKLKLSQQ